MDLPYTVEENCRTILSGTAPDILFVLCKRHRPELHLQESHHFYFILSFQHRQPWRRGTATSMTTSPRSIYVFRDGTGRVWEFGDTEWRDKHMDRTCCLKYRGAIPRCNATSSVSVSQLADAVAG